MCKKSSNIAVFLFAIRVAGPERGPGVGTHPAFAKTIAKKG